jgi:hypothetical protein
MDDPDFVYRLVYTDEPVELPPMTEANVKTLLDDEEYEAWQARRNAASELPSP